MNKLELWQERYQKAKSHYSATRDELTQYTELYGGTYEIETHEVSEVKGKVKRAKSVRNIVAENIDSIVDSNIPTPKVTAKREKDEMLADKIEGFLRNELDRIPFEAINDEDERNTSIFGGDLFLVEWDNNGGTHTTIGELKVSLVDPMHFVPQENVNDINKCDYIFFEVQVTKDGVKDQYGVDLTDEVADDEDITMIVAYYKNRKKDCIGRYSWVNDKEIEDIPDYFARILNVCKKCGEVVYGDTCKYCGSKAIEKQTQDYQELYNPITDRDGNVRIPDKQISYQMDSMGNTSEVEGNMKVPYYRINQFPIALRKNITMNNKLLGESDVKRIKDQQNAIKKHETKMMEKLEKAGSFVTMPKGMRINRTNEEMVIVEIDKPEEVGMIQTINLQGDVSNDLNYINYNYEASRYVLGITDSFQGRQDTTATSGKAKEFAASQTAGRLESKKVMKNACYADLFQLMFKFMLAFADEPRNIVSKDNNGKVTYSEFDKYEFLEMDEAGELYWNDEFLFSVDSAAALANNREAMWQETRMNLEGGALGNPQDMGTLVRFWTIMESLHYPKATQIKIQLQEEQQKQDQMMQMQQQMNQMQQQIAMQNQELNNAQEIANQAQSQEAEYDRQDRELDIAQKQINLMNSAKGGNQDDMQ